jgi:clan AA aspartic protease (TIGR02281 family)
MPTRSQLLTHGATLAIGMTVGSLATVTILPAVRHRSKAPASATPASPAILPPVAAVDAKAKGPGEVAVPSEAPPQAKALPEKKRARTVVDATEQPGPEPVRPPQEAEQATKPSPEDVLRNKGLRVSGQVAVLELEDDLKRREVELGLAFQEQTRIWARMSVIGDLAQTLQKEWRTLEQTQQQILMRRLADSREPAGNPNNDGRGALDPPDEEQQRPTDEPGQEKKSKDSAKKKQREGNGPAPKGPAVNGRTLEAEWVQNQNRMNTIENQLSNLKSEYAGLDRLAMKKQAVIERQFAELQLTGDDLARRYRELAGDREVVIALQELNTHRAAPIVLGPRGNFRANLLKLKEVQQAGGRRPELMLETRQNRDVKSVEFHVRRAEERLIKAWDRQQEQTKAPASRAHQPAGKETAQVTTAEEIRTLRNEFAQNVAELRRAVDEAMKRYAALKQDPQFKKARLAPVSLATRTYLERAEAAIETREIRLERDRAVSWVDAMVNHRATKMLIDPGVEFVRMSSDAARELGISPSETDATVELAMPDGQKFKARRTAIKALQVGPFLVEDVECLVVLGPFEAPPLLGASFLDHFDSRLDPAAENLVLVRVDMKKLPSKLASRGSPRPPQAGR